MSGRPEDGYRVRVRLESGGGRRSGGPALAVVALVVVGLVVFGSRLADLAAVDSSPLLTASPGAPQPTFEAPPPVETPLVEIGSGIPPRSPLPMRTGGLDWLDPATGVVSSAEDGTSTDWLFELPGGGVLSAYLEGGSSSPARSALHLRVYGAHGGTIRDIVVRTWEQAVNDVMLDIALDPDAGTVLVASATWTEAGWILQLERLGYEFGAVPFQRDLGIVTHEELQAATLYPPRISMSPDGSRVRVRITTQPHEEPRPGPALVERTWIVPLSEEDFGEPREVADAFPGPDPAFCPAEGWATATDYVWLCQTPAIDESQLIEVFLRVEHGNGSAEQVSLGQHPPDTGMGWQVDGRAGIVYGWSSGDRHLYRYDVAHDSLTQRAIDSCEAPIEQLSEASLPPRSAAPTLWSPITRASDIWQSPLAGSADGTQLFAMSIPSGFVGASPAACEQVGVWVFDAATLAIVGAWAPLGYVTQIALTPDGEMVVVGSLDPETRFGQPIARSVVAFYAVDGGGLAEVIRGVVDPFGANPFFLPLGPPLPVL
jgi:hypothetical protein